MPNPNLQVVKTRAVLNRYIREFFHARGVLEVETPILSQAGNTDPNIESFTTTFTGSDQHGKAKRWLRTSPEFPLKRLLVVGVGDCYELGKVFRNGEAGRRHNPEFTMLEWYRAGWNHLQLADEVVELLQGLFRAVGREHKLRRATYAELFHEIGIDPHRDSLETLQNRIKDRVMDVMSLERDDCLQVLLSHALEPHFPPDQLLILHDFPASQCALAKLRRETEVAIAERFEIYVGTTELANGYHELQDAEEQSRRFHADNEKRLARNLGEVDIDANLLEALHHGLPACSGVALGVDRLLGLLTQSDSLPAILPFPFSEA